MSFKALRIKQPTTGHWKDWIGKMYYFEGRIQILTTSLLVCPHFDVIHLTESLISLHGPAFGPRQFTLLSSSLLWESIQYFSHSMQNKDTWKQTDCHSWVDDPIRTRSSSSQSVNVPVSMKTENSWGRFNIGWLQDSQLLRLTMPIAIWVLLLFWLNVLIRMIHTLQNW